MFRAFFTKYESSKFYRNRLIKKYKQKINPKMRKQDKIINSLKNRFDFTKINAEEIDPIFFKFSVLENLSAWGVNASSVIFKFIR